MFRVDRAPGGGTYLILKYFLGVPQPPPRELLFALLAHVPPPSSPPPPSSLTLQLSCFIGTTKKIAQHYHVMTGKFI